ncbi:MAG: hypothetical protein OEX01_08085 [Candidatus Bathyarchaeota archaeon]|nr:hypothetical protein [Candidatus Bathyarchaeota archaeon]
MNGDLLTLIIGAIIGIVASMIAYCLNSILRVREQSIAREFTMRKEARHFFEALYGTVSRLDDLVKSYREFQKEGGKVLMLTEKGYDWVSGKDIIKDYKNIYEERSKLWADAVSKGYEVFLPPDLADELVFCWAVASYLYQNDEWKKLEIDLLSIFDEISKGILTMIEESLGLRRKRLLRKPKWLNWRQIRSIIRSGKTV